MVTCTRKGERLQHALTRVECFALYGFRSTSILLCETLRFVSHWKCLPFVSALLLRNERIVRKPFQFPLWDVPLLVARDLHFVTEADFVIRTVDSNHAGKKDALTIEPGRNEGLFSQVKSSARGRSWQSKDKMVDFPSVWFWKILFSETEKLL